jgi:cbb3-type cytochrome oxidase subunit 3
MQTFLTTFIATTPIFVAIFLGILAYALWPGNRKEFEDAARMPLREDSIMTKREADTGAGTHTTGHAWDGIEELNSPLPRWWLWTFYATIAWAFAYWIFYPAGPIVSSYTTGVLGYSTRGQVDHRPAGFAVPRRGAATVCCPTSKRPGTAAFARPRGRLRWQ